MRASVVHLDFELIPNGGRPIGAVLEARIALDADDVLSQRLPAAELQIGSVHEQDEKLTELLAAVLAGRGLTTHS